MNIPGSLDLRYLVAVAGEAGFTAAGRRVHVARQVLSAQVRQLEDAVGFQLPRRTNRGVAVVRDGEQLSGLVPQLAGVTAAPGHSLHYRNEIRDPWLSWIAIPPIAGSIKSPNPASSARRLTIEATFAF